MTRINSAIHVKCLTDEHLLAEHREIKRLPYNLQQAIKSGNIKHIPEKFTLGKGHIMFFLNKMEFVYNRYVNVYCEAKGRGFEVQSFADNFNKQDINLQNYWNPYLPTNEEKQLLIERITERINNSTKKHFHYYGKQITKKEAIELLNNVM